VDFEITGVTEIVKNKDETAVEHKPAVPPAISRQPEGLNNEIQKQQGSHRPQTPPPVLPPNPTARSSPVRSLPATGIPTRRL